MSQVQSSPGSSFTTFAVGALIGGGIALLYAPQSGKETRKLLAQKASLLRNKAQATVAKTEQFVQEGKAYSAATSDSRTETAGQEWS